jgi:hypothetical protein
MCTCVNVCVCVCVHHTSVPLFQGGTSPLRAKGHPKQETRDPGQK